MRAFICVLDPSGLRRFIPEGLIPEDDLCHLVGSLPPSSTTMVWTLLADDDADDLRADVRAGRHALVGLPRLARIETVRSKWGRATTTSRVPEKL